MRRFRVGLQLHPQATSVADLRIAWREADRLGVDSIWVWDHFYPLYGDPDAEHFEGWTLLSAMACDTTRAQVGVLVTCNSYRNPELLADMARTVDHLSSGRAVLGIGAGWFERDYQEFGYEFGTAASRLRDLEESLRRIKIRFAKLNPKPQGEMPILIGGGGEKVTLRLVAQHANMWNGFGPSEQFARKNELLDQWCAKVGRDPSAIERTISFGGEVNDAVVRNFLDAGATHLIYGMGHPFDLEPVQRLIQAASTS